MRLRHHPRQRRSTHMRHTRVPARTQDCQAESKSSEATSIASASESQAYVLQMRQRIQFTRIRYPQRVLQRNPHMSEPSGATHALNTAIWERANPPIREGELYTCYMYDSITGQVKFHADNCSSKEAQMYKEMADHWQLFFRLYPC